MKDAKFTQYAINLLSIDEAARAGTLYRKEFINGEIKNKPISGFLRSLLTHVFYVVTFQTTKIKTIEQEKLSNLFYSNMDFLQNPSTTAQSRFAKIRITDLSREQFSNLSFIAEACAKNFPQLKQIIKSKTQDWAQERQDLGIKGKKLYADLLLSQLDPRMVKVASQKMRWGKIENLLKELTPGKQKLLAKCLEIAPEVANYKKAGEKGLDPSEVDAIEAVAKHFYNKLNLIHREFEKQNGKVNVEKGEPNPSLKQLEAAFEIVMKLTPQLGHPITPEGKLIFARMVQYVMCGQSQISSINFPQTEFCFSCKEFKKCQDILPFPKDRHNIIEWHIKDSEFYRSAEKKDEDLPQIAEKAITSYLRSFFSDLFRSSRPIRMNDRQFDLKTPANIQQMFIQLRSDLYNQILSNKQDWETYLQDIEQTAAIPANLTKEDYTNWVLNGFHQAIAGVGDKTKMMECLPILLEQSEFDDSQMNTLLDTVPQEKRVEYREKFDGMLRNHLLQFMLLFNQSSLGAGPDSFGVDILKHPANRLIIKLEADAAPKDNGSYFTYDGGHFESVNKIKFVLTEASAEQIGLDLSFDPPNYKVSEERAIPIVTLDRKLSVTWPLGTPSMTNFENVQVRLQSLPLLRQIHESLKAKS